MRVLSRGLRESHDNCAAVMTADLQNPSEVIRKLLNGDAGALVAWAVRERREGPALSIWMLSGRFCHKLPPVIAGVVTLQRARRQSVIVFPSAALTNPSSTRAESGKVHWTDLQNSTSARSNARLSIIRTESRVGDFNEL